MLKGDQQMTFSKYSKTANSFLLTTLAFGLISCSGGGGGTNTGVPTSSDPATALTQGISFVGGTLKEGQPPAPTFAPGDPVIIEPTITNIPTLTPGMNGSIDVQIDQIPLDTTSFNINIQFNKSTNQYNSITINDPNLISNIVSSGGTGTLSLPFSLDTSVCNNLGDIQHQIKCYESVQLPDGTRVSKEAAQQMVLACGIGSGTANTYFAEDPDSALDLNNDPSDDLCIEVVASQSLIDAENTRITNENTQSKQNNGGVLLPENEQSTFSLGTCPVKYSGLACVISDPVNTAVISFKFTNLAPTENVNAFCAINGGIVQ